MTESPLHTALSQLEDGALHIAHELRLMAAATPPYAHFSTQPDNIKNLWLTAAQILEETHIPSQQH